MQPVGSWRPDLAESNPGLATIATNVIVQQDANGLAHGPHPSLAVSGSATALPAAPRGGGSTINSTGSFLTFVGTSTNIYRMSAAFELDAGQSVGSGYSLPSGDYWSFAPFKGYFHATNTADGLLKFAVDTDSAWSAVSGAPAGRYGFPAFNTFILLDCDGDNRLLRNSAIGNSLIWEGKGAGYRIMPDGGALIAGAELSPDFAIILQTEAIRGLFRRNDSQLYEVRKITSERGAANPRAFCHIDGICWFLDTQGFFEYSLDGGLKNIGKDKIAKTFLDELASGGFESVEMEVDRATTRVFVRYQANDVGSETVFEDLLTYDYRLQEWTKVEESTSGLVNLATSAYTVDDLGPFGATVDDHTISWDSRFWSGDQPRIMALNGDYKLGPFDGANLASISETSAIVSPRSVMVRSVTPSTDAANGTIRLIVRDREANGQTVGSAVSMQASGRYPVRGRGKVRQYRFEVPAGEAWTYFRGLDGEAGRAGGVR